MITEIPRGDPTVYAPGTWTLVPQDELGDRPYYTAIIWCPACGKPLLLQREHGIQPDGQLSDYVGHPLGSAPCSWFCIPMLLDWPNLTAPLPRPFSTCDRCGKQSRAIGGWGTDGRYCGIICAECKAALAS